MNKTLNIGLAGYSFIIDEKAYQKLSIYLQALRNTLAPNEADEVMLDIEYRMVEIFRENLKNREIINEEDVEKVITQIGKPELLEEHNHSQDNHSPSSFDLGKIKNATRSLFRDPTDQKIAGVCSGMAHWSKMDTSLMRILWLGLFLFGLFVIPPFFLVVLTAYIALWAILPKATTATDFLKMKGEPINFDSLKNESLKRSQIQDSGSPINTTNQTDYAIWRIIRYIFGSICAVMAFSFLSALLAVFFVNKYGVYANFTLSELLNYYFNSTHLQEYFTLLYVLFCLIPALIFSMLSIKFFSPKTKVRNIGYLTLLLILITIPIGIITGLKISETQIRYSGTKSETENVSINTTKDTLYLQSKEIFIPKHFKDFDNGHYFTDKKLVYQSYRPQVEVTRDETAALPYLIIKTRANGYNHPIVSKVNVEIRDNEILLPNYFQFPYEERFRNYRVHYELVIPSSKTLLSKDKKIHINDDNDNDDGSENHQVPDERNEYRSVQKIIINGKKIEIEKNSAFGDSIKINGKRYDEETAERIIDDFKNQRNQ